MRVRTIPKILFILCVTVFWLWGWCYGEVYRITNFNALTHATSNIVIDNSTETLRVYPTYLRKPNEIVRYDFSLRDRRSRAPRVGQPVFTRDDERLTYEGYLGTALEFRRLSPPVAVAVPEYLYQKPVYGWGLELYFYPTALQRHAKLLHSSRIVKNIKTSIPYIEEWLIAVEAGKVVTALQNLFHTIDGKTGSLELTSEALVDIGAWNKLQLWYDPQTATVEQWLNGRFSARAQASFPDRLPTSSYYFYMNAGDQTLANNNINRYANEAVKPTHDFNLGERFYGRIDEIVFYDAKLDPTVRPHEERMPATERSAFFTATWSSRVVRLEPFTHIYKVEALGTAITTDAVNVYVCASADYFPEQSFPPVASDRVNCQTGVLGRDFSGRTDYFYYQVFLLVKSRTYPYPNFSEITLSYASDDPPFTPVLTAVKSLPGAIFLQFKAGFEDDIAGYVLTYRSERERLARKIRIPLSMLTQNKQNIYEYNYLLDNLAGGTAYILKLQAYDRISNDGERVSLGSAQTTIVTQPSISSSTTTTTTTTQDF
ncbi:hypothetical protein COTS27_00104 [Spirochaetota bacterium]|nr:hypothetical protein COTS27_00104 [Spirochaetota bacterium]